MELGVKHSLSSVPVAFEEHKIVAESLHLITYHNQNIYKAVYLKSIKHKYY